MSNAMASDDNDVEIRLMVPRRVANLLDAHSIANRQTRTQYLLGIVVAWDTLRRHEMTIAARIAGRKPSDAAADGSDSDFYGVAAE